ncbi:MAG: MFS transporter, partial [Acetatifactor sp.]|nr:MFS transporter [Acetatifactor sp.]
MNQEKITRRNLIFFPLGTMGRDAVYSLMNSYLLTFVLFTHSLDAAQLAAITGIMIAARAFDALNDPVMGNIIERTRSRFGKFKPWLAAGGVSTSVVIFLLFNVRLQGWPFVWFFALMYFAFSITYTMSDISYWGMIPALGSDADTRNQFTSRTTLFAGVGGTLAAILIPLFTTGSGALGGSTAVAYGRVALVIAILAPLFILFTLLGVRERREVNRAAKRERFSFRQILKTIARNDQLVWV